MKRFLFFLIFISLAAFGCKKDKNPVIVAANGVRVFIQVQHHEVPIPYATVFVKKGTVDFPGLDTTLYDARYVTDANGKITFTGISNGQGAFVYYAKGFDPGWDSTHVTPVWGYQFLITDTHTGENNDYTVSIPVSE
jgi:hypothetical protein